MTIGLFKLLILLGYLLPLWLASWAVWSRLWRGAEASASLLASMITVPLILILALCGLGTLLPGRPLDNAWIGQLVLDGVALGVAWRFRTSLASSVRRVRGGLCVGWAESLWSQRVILLVGLGTHLIATAYGSWATPWEVDELSYHMPQALQAYQDGRLGNVQANVAWADSYPRGAELLYTWTLLLSRSDVGCHPVNAAFGLIMILATYVAARRVGLSRGWSLAAAGLLPTAPLFFHLSTIGYIDLCVAGAVCASVAMALPEPDNRWGWPASIATMIGLLLALWMKLPSIAITGVLLLYLLVRAFLWRIRGSSRVALSVWNVGFASGLMLLAASVPYVRTWIVYGTPCYPVRLKIGPWLLFDGPLHRALSGRPFLDEISHYSILQRYSAMWTGWWEPITSDSRGSLGPLFTLAFLVSALLVLFVCLRRPRAGWVLLVLVFWSVLFIPEFHLPRYGLYILLPGALFAAWVGQALGRAWPASAWGVTLLALQLFNVHLTYEHVMSGLRWQRSFGIPLLTEMRNRPLAEKLVRYDERSPAPETRQELYGLMRPGETVVSAVHGYQTLLHDWRYSYRVEHRPARSWPAYHDHCARPEFGREDAEEWLAGLVRDEIRAVIVYRGSAEDSTLMMAPNVYAESYEQPGKAGTFPVVIYRRSEG